MNYPNRQNHDPGFDEALAKTMQHVNAPEDLLARVLAAAQTQQQPRSRVLAFPKAPAWFSGAIAAMLLVGCLTAERIHVVHQQQREQAALTEQQFDTAMRITNRALDQTQQQLAKSGITLGN